MKNLIITLFVAAGLLHSPGLTAQQEISLKTREISVFDGGKMKLKSTTVNPPSEAVSQMVERIIEAGKGTGRNFDLYAAPVGTVLSLITEEEGRMLLYDPAVLPEEEPALSSSWEALGLLVHQVGQHVKLHYLSRPEIEEEVIEADLFSGYVLFRLGATLEQAQRAWQSKTPEAGTRTHADRATRLRAVEKGYNSAKAQGKTSNLASCPGFSDAPNPDEAMDMYVLYRDYMKRKEWDLAFDFWKQVYAVAPAADGRRNDVITDGIQFYEHFYRQAEDSLQKEKYIDRIFELYDRIEACFPQGGGYVAGRKAFDLYYQYPHRAGREEIFALFRKSIDTDGLNTNFFVLNPFTSLLVEMYGKGVIGEEEAKAYEQQVRKILAQGLEECEGRGCEPWFIIDEYVPARLEAFEAIKGFYESGYYIDKYFPDFLADSTSCEVIMTVYSRLAWGNTPEDAPELQRLVEARREHCAPAGTRLVREGYDCLETADYDCAIEKFEQAAAESDDPEKQGTYLMLVAKVYQSHKKDFPRSREYALRAAEARPDWGDPYIHIGRLYASSGPLCGPGRGWDSQIVTWPAIDMWNKAKRVDPSVAEEANDWIRRYSQYMPTVGDIFQRRLKEGQRFFVPCWIQEWTTVRATR